MPLGHVDLKPTNNGINFTFYLKDPTYSILSYFRRVKNNVEIEGSLPENISLPRYKNSIEIIINHEGTRMVKDGEH